MIGYAKYALNKLQHPTLTRPQHSPHQWTVVTYGSIAPQLEHPKDEYPKLNPDKARNAHKILETFLFYALAVDLAMIVTLNTIADKQ